MRIRGRSMLLTCVVFVVACLVFGVGVACGDESSVLGGTGSSAVESPLVAPGVDQLLGGQPAREVEEARRASPEAVAAREESENEYGGMTGEEAKRLDGETFSSLVVEPSGGPPKLPSGESVTGFPSANVEQVDLGGGRHGVIESLLPIAVEESPGKRVPVDLGLREVSGGFEPATPAVAVQIPAHVGDGVALSGSGISLTPVTALGVALEGSGAVLDGASVVYANTQVDSDTVVKPTTLGFEASTVLRSTDSPQQLFFRVGLPEGASLVQQTGSGSVQVVKEGTVLATVAVPQAVDATGAAVPVSMTVSGDMLSLKLEMTAGEYQYPVYVDPTVTDKELLFNPGSWLFFTDNKKVFEGFKTSKGLEDTDYEEAADETYYEGQYGFFSYTTQGASRIYAFVASAEETDFEKPSDEITDEYELRYRDGEVEPGNGVGGKARVGYQEKGIYKRSGVTVCAESACGPVSVSGSEQNAAYFEQKATGEEKGGFRFLLESASVEINQEEEPKASFDTSDPTVNGLPNALYPGKWYKSTSNAVFAINALDEGIGIYKQGLSSPSKSGWGYSVKNEAQNECQGVQCNECYEAPCYAKKSGTGKPLTFSLAAASGGELPEGEDTVEGRVEDAAGLGATVKGKIKIANAPPSITSFSGLPSDHEVIDGEHVSLKAGAESGPAGIAGIVLDLDGQQLGGPQGSCSGSCKGHAEWTLSGENYAAGEHTLTVIAEDTAGNVGKAEYHFVIHHPEDVAVGPGSVNPVTGQLSLTATDVSIGAPNGALTVTRSYRSQHLEQGGVEGPLGPQWNMGLGPQQSLTRVQGGMILTGVSGGEVVFEGKGGGEFASPTGDAGLILSEKTKEGKTYFTLTENGSVTAFELPTGSTGGVWMPSSVEGPNGTNMSLYKFRLNSGVIEPTEELAPVPPEVSCGKEISELKEGCRALKFEYDEGATTAKGEKESEWGEFKGHLSRVKYIAWKAKTKEELVVAEYLDDAKGRLRAVWNPQIKPELKTTYGYDSENHVTAVSTAGHEPTLFEQGTIPGDASPGRLLAVAVPSAAVPLGGGEAPASTEAPALSSTTPKVGVKISVTLTGEKIPGKWTGSPLAFIYQWEDCNSKGEECSPILGAVNQAYYPVTSDAGHKLVVEVSALNATGTTIASSAVTSTVASGTPNTLLPEPPEVGTDAVTTLEYQVPVSGREPYEMGSSTVAEWGQIDDPKEAMAVFPPDKVMGWPAKEYKRETVYYLDGKDRTVNVAAPTGGISTAEFNAYNDVTRTLSPDNRAAALKESKPAEAAEALSTESHYNGETTEEKEKEEKEVGEKLKPAVEPGTELLSTLGPRHTVKLAVGKEGKTNEEALAREHTIYSYNEGAPSGGGPYHLVTKTVDEAETTSKEVFDTRTTETKYNGQSSLGWKLRKPTSVITDPTGLDLVHTIEYKANGDVIQTMMPAASGKDAKVPPTYTTKFGSAGSGAGQFAYAAFDTVDSKGDVWVTDFEGNRLDEFSATGSFIQAVGFGVGSKGEEKFEACTSSCKAGKPGSGNGQFSGPVGIVFYGGDLYVTDYRNDRIEQLNEKGEYLSKFGVKGTAAGQFEGPVSIAATTTGNLWVGDLGNYRLQEFNSSGTFIKAIGYGVNAGEGKVFEICTTSCKAGLSGSGAGQFSAIEGIAVSSSSIYVADDGNNHVEKFNKEGEYVSQFGSKGTGNGQFKAPEGVALGGAGAYIYVTDWGNNRVEVFSTTSNAYLTQFASTGSGNGQVKGPEGVAVASSGEIYVVDNGNDRVEEWVPTVTGNENAHSTKTIYYEEGASVAACRKNPEWSGLPCETMPAAQPGTSGLPEIPTTTMTYNIWIEPETIKETAGSNTRTTTNTFDEAGRPKTAAVTATVGEPVPTVTDEYNKESGAPEKQCENEGKPCTEGHPKAITAIENKLGQLESYTDAAESTTSLEYDVDGRTKKISDSKGAETKGTESFKYNTTTGLLSELLYEYTPSKLQLPFTATYDPEGKILSEHYPNNMTANYIYNKVGNPINLEYKKNAYCATTCPEVWFNDKVVPSIHGQWIEQTSTLSHQLYSYDAPGRLTQVQNTVNGKCTTRLYAYDEDTNRTSLTTREPGTEGKCATEGGNAQTHTYDTADRLTDPGIAYNPFGDITTLPAADAEEPGEHPLTSTFYADGQIASQTQNEQTVGDTLDPAGRTLETIASGKPNNSTTINHYTGPANAPTWTENALSHEWQRNIAGINGTLAAIQNNGENPELQLTNLHGDIIAKAYLSETATALAAKADTSEYGVPTVSAPAKYSWLGAIQLPTELPSGVINMGARSYVPQIGRFLQPDPIPGGSANAYAYTFGDPVNTSDPTGAYTATASKAILMELEGQEIASDANGIHQREEREAAERYAAEQAARAAAEAAAEAAATAGPQYEEEWEEWWEEESEYEYISNHRGGEYGKEEPAILVQPLVTEAGGWSETQLLVKGGAECFNRSQCARKDRALRRGGSGQVEEDCVKGVAGYVLIGTPADALNPAGDVGSCLVGVILGKI